jgi:hypothetical protein
MLPFADVTQMSPLLIGGRLPTAHRTRRNAFWIIIPHFTSNRGWAFMRPGVPSDSRDLAALRSFVAPLPQETAKLQRPFDPVAVSLVQILLARLIEQSPTTIEAFYAP